MKITILLTSCSIRIVFICFALRFDLRKQGGGESERGRELMILTALHVFISTLFLRCSSTLSRFPARAARKNEVFPSDYKIEKKIDVY